MARRYGVRATAVRRTVMSVVSTSLIVVSLPLRPRHISEIDLAGLPTDAFLSTGLGSLDDVGCGMRPGDLWFLTSPPGQGRSTLATQMAVASALSHGFDTWLVSNRDPVEEVAVRVHANVGRVPLNHIRRHELNAVDLERLSRTRKRLHRAPLSLLAGKYAADKAIDLLSHNSDPPRAIFFDDPAWQSDWQPQLFRRLADAGMFVLVTVPRHEILTGPAFHGDLTPGAGFADAVIEVRLHDLAMADDRLSDEPGIAALTVLRNRRGPTATGTALFLGHRAQFADR